MHEHHWAFAQSSYLNPYHEGHFGINVDRKEQLFDAIQVRATRLVDGAPHCARYILSSSVQKVIWLVVHPMKNTVSWDHTMFQTNVWEWDSFMPSFSVGFWSNPYVFSRHSKAWSKAAGLLEITLACPHLTPCSMKNLSVGSSYSWGFSFKSFWKRWWKKDYLEIDVPRISVT